MKLWAEFDTAARALRYNAECDDGNGKYSYSSALYRIDKIILGWGKAFAFCNGSQSMKALDDFGSQRLMSLEATKTTVLTKADGEARRRVLGVRLLSRTRVTIDQ